MKEKKKGRKAHPPQTKTLGVVSLVAYLSHGSLSRMWIKNILNASERAIYRYIRTIRRAGLYVFTSSGGEEGTRYSFWLHTKRMTKVTIEWEDGFREEFFPHELAILPVKKYSDEELVEIEKAKKKAKKKK